MYGWLKDNLAKFLKRKQITKSIYNSNAQVWASLPLSKVVFKHTWSIFLGKSIEEARILTRKLMNNMYQLLY